MIFRSISTYAVIVHDCCENRLFERKSNNENAKSRRREGKQRSVYFVAPFIRDNANKYHCSDIKSILSNVIHIPLTKTIKELDNLILKGMDLYDHTKVFL